MTRLSIMATPRPHDWIGPRGNRRVARAGFWRLRAKGGGRGRHKSDRTDPARRPYLRVTPYSKRPASLGLHAERSARRSEAAWPPAQWQRRRPTWPEHLLFWHDIKEF